MMLNASTNTVTRDSTLSALGTDVAANIPANVAVSAVEHLLEWQAADEPDIAWQKICHWRQAHSQHEQAWQQIESVNKKIAVLAVKAEPDVSHAALTAPSISRREALKTLSILLVVGSSGSLVYRQQPWQNWLADYHTTTGQQQLSLSDGTAITLNVDTAINVRYTATERRMVLVKGEVYIRTAKLSKAEALNRPFIVEVEQGELQPLGTRFSARVLPDTCRVSVYQGRVQVQAATDTQSMIVDTGQSLAFSKTARSATQAVTEAEAAWTQGMVVASDMRLQDFLIELNRYRVGVIQCDPAIAHLKVSGTYPINKVDAVLQVLPHSLPIKVQTFTRYWTRVLPAA